MLNFKKILSYFILFFAFCLICVGIVHAETTFTTVSSTSLQNCLNSGVCIDESDFWNNILSYNDLIQKDDDFDYYTIYYDLSIDKLFYVRSNNPLYIRYDYDSNSYLGFRFVQSSVAWREISYTINSSGTITDAYFRDYTYSGTDLFNLSANNNTINNIVLASNQLNYLYNYTSTPNNSSFTITGSGTYNINDHVPLSFLNGSVYHWEPTDIFTDNTLICTHVASQIGYASYVDTLYFDFHSNSRVPLEGDILLMSKDFVGIGVNADAVGNLSYKLADDNTAENIVFNYSTSWDNSTQYPTLVIHYNLSDSTSGGFDSYMHVILTFTLNTSQPVVRYFQNNVYIFLNTCNDMNSVSYGYSNYKDNINVSSDPYLENYINNLSLPNLQFFNNFNTLLPAGPVDSILTLPLLMLNTISTNLSGNCTPININLPYVNKNIQLKCVNDFYNNIGLGNFLSFVGLVVSVIMLINYFVFLYNWLDQVFTLSHMNVEIWGVDPNSGVKL